MKAVYEPQKNYSREEVKNTVERNEPEELAMLVVSVSFHSEDRSFAERLCLNYGAHDFPWLRANAILGLSHIARNHGKLNRKLVKPILENALKDSIEHVEGTAQDVIEDLETWLKWKFKK